MYPSSVPLRPARAGRFAGLSVSCTALDDHLACLRRRSYAGKPSTPQYGITAAAFKQRFVDIQVVNSVTCVISRALIAEFYILLGQ